MKRCVLILMMTMAAVAIAWGQDINLSQFEALKSRASDTVEVNLSEPMLRLAAGFMNGQDANQTSIKKILEGLKGIYVRNLKFDKEGQYSTADAEAIRAQLKSAGWQSVVDVHSSKPGGDNAGVYLRNGGKSGVVVLSFQPKEFTVVNLSGSIDLAQIQALSGQLGIPSFNAGFNGGGEGRASGNPHGTADGGQKDK